MLHFITAIYPEAAAVIGHFSMTRLTGLASFGRLTIYHTADDSVYLLQTGSGKLSAAAAVTEYLAFLGSDEFPRPEDKSVKDIFEHSVFCNIGICGATDAALLRQGFFCSALYDISSEKCLYPELFSHFGKEAVLAGADIPVTKDTLSFFDAKSAVSPVPEPPDVPADNLYLFLKTRKNLPLLYDMEGFGVFFALFRKISPKQCICYKIVSDLCDGAFLSPEEITALVKGHLPALSDYLIALSLQLQKQEPSPSLVLQKAQYGQLFPFSVTMTHKLNQLLTYADTLHLDLSAAVSEKIAELESKKNPSTKGFTKMEARLFLNFLEHYVLHSLPDHTATACAETQPPPRDRLRLFTRIYVETGVFDASMTQQILARFPGLPVIPIRHYKDVFCQSRQDFTRQKKEPSLLLAANRSTRFYPGAPVCQSFHEEHFLYTSCIMNCIYDCDYCYLQGMYPSGNLVVFVNTEDYFTELEALLLKHPVYLCCSYDSDLTALSGLFPHAEQFVRFAAGHPALRLELRTKCAAIPFLRRLPAVKNVIPAFTVSPQELIDRFEHFTPSLTARLRAAKEAANRGFSVRLCIDPVLDVPGAVLLYQALVETIFTVLSPGDITDISLGVFRISKDYMKQLCTVKPACPISHYPYTLTNGVFHYDAKRSKTLLSAVSEALLAHGISKNQLFFWTPEDA